MIERQQKMYGWEFLFLGANIDSVEMGAMIGIDRDFTVDYCADEAGTRANFEAMDSAISYARNCSAPMRSNWKAAVERDKKKKRHMN